MWVYQKMQRDRTKVYQHEYLGKEYKVQNSYKISILCSKNQWFKDLLIQIAVGELHKSGKSTKHVLLFR